MRVTFKTNLDWYKQIQWPTLDVVPRVGETIFATDESKKFCIANKIPFRLKVVDVSYHQAAFIGTSFQSYAECELWFHPNDTEAAKVGGTLDHLYKQ